jgi:hypothetical protein
MKNNKGEQLKFEAKCFELTRALNDYDRVYNKCKNKIRMEAQKNLIDIT